MSEPRPGDLMRRRWPPSWTGVLFLLDARALKEQGRRVSVTVPADSVGVLVAVDDTFRHNGEWGNAIFLIGERLVFDDLRAWDRVEEQCD